MLREHLSDATAPIASAFLGVKNTTGYCYYAAASLGATGYGPFTGAHDALILKDADIEPGDIVCDKTVVARNGVSDTLTEVVRSAAANQPAPLGVMVSRKALIKGDQLAAFSIDGVSGELAEVYDHLTVNSLGEGQINVCDYGGPIEAGDLIVCSDLPGKGMRQVVDGEPDDIVRSYTVARAREAATFDESGLAQIACIYLCG